MMGLWSEPTTGPTRRLAIIVLALTITLSIGRRSGHGIGAGARPFQPWQHAQPGARFQCADDASPWHGVEIADNDPAARNDLDVARQQFRLRHLALEIAHADQPHQMGAEHRQRPVLRASNAPSITEA